jgi:hypothetical protein
VSDHNFASFLSADIGEDPYDEAVLGWAEQQAIGAALRQHFTVIVEEPIPASFVDLLARLEAEECRPIHP